MGAQGENLVRKRGHQDRVLYVHRFQLLGYYTHVTRACTAGEHRGGGVPILQGSGKQLPSIGQHSRW